MHYYFDTEVYRNYFLLVLYPEDDQNFAPKCLEVHNDAITFNMLKDFKWHEHVFVSFNGIGYDMVVIAAIQAGFSNQQIKDISDDIIVNGTPWWEVYAKNGLSRPTLNHIDISNVLPLKQSLKLYGGRAHAQRLQDLPLDPGSFIEDEHTPLMQKYCINDCKLTRHLYHIVEPQIQLRQRMGAEYGMDLRSKSDAQIAETVISSEFYRRSGIALMKPFDTPDTFKYQDPGFIKFKTHGLQKFYKFILDMEFGLKASGHVQEPKELKATTLRVGGQPYQPGVGGLHSIDGPGSFYSDCDYVIFDIDVASYYPSIVLNAGYEPAHMFGYFLPIYQELVTKRLNAKHSGDKVTADALKITINGTFGKLGSKYSKLYSPNLMLNVTLTGQLCLLMLIEQFPHLVISANTDGIMVKVSGTELDRIKEIVQEWEYNTGFDMEWTEYKSVHRRDVNNYFAVKPDGSVKTKGIFAATNLSKNPNFQVIQHAAMQYFITGAPVEQTVRDCDDLNMFVAVRTARSGAQYRGQVIGKVVRWYRSWLSAENMTTTNKKGVVSTVALSDNCVPMLDLHEDMPKDIDYQWYIDEATELVKLIQ